MSGLKISRFSLAIFFVGISLSVLIHYNQHHFLRERALVLFTLDAEDAFHRIDKSFRVHAGLLSGVKNFFAASQDVRADEFEIYASHSLQEHGILAACYVADTGSRYYSPATASSICEEFFTKKELTYHEERNLFAFGSKVESATGISGYVNILFNYNSLVAEVLDIPDLSVQISRQTAVHKAKQGEFFLAKENLPSIAKLNPDFVISIRGDKAGFIGSPTWQHYALIVMLLILALVGFKAFQYMSRTQQIIRRHLARQEDSLKAQFEETLHHKRVADHQTKLASLGVLAAGVGHEINNPLLVIKGYVTNLMESAQDRKTIETLQKIDTAADRIAGITAGLRTFSRTDEEESASFNPYEAVKESFDLVRGIYLVDDIKLSLSVREHDTQCLVEGNRSKFQQVIMNLLSNARDAVESSATKFIRIDLECADEHYIIRVADSGIGIPENVREHILDPFFTTKDVDKGTGIGLSFVNNFVGEMNGSLEIESQEGHGSEFRILIPLSSKAEKPAADLATLNASGTENTMNRRVSLSKNVLLVDDEEMIRELLVSMLEDLGLTVTEASNGKEALEKLIQPGAHFDLVISDMKMPKMTGPMLLSRIREEPAIQPQPKFIFITGGVNVNLDDPTAEHRHDGHIYKPFDEKDLTAEILKVLGPVEQPAKAQ